MNKKQVANELFQFTGITKEQYEVFKQLVEDLDLDTPKQEETWEDLAENL